MNVLIPSPKPVAVVGGGIAGLSAARRLREHGVPVVLFEGSDRVAGLARSFQDDSGFTFDFGAHFITNRLAKCVGIEKECRDVKYYGESVLVHGKLYPYPFGLVGNPRYLSSAFLSRARGLFEKEPAESAAEWFARAYGSAMADEIAIPLVEAWSGTAASDLAPSVGDKLGASSIAKVLWLRAAGRLQNKAIANGYCSELPESAQVWHVYPEKGVARVCEKLAEEMTEVIQLNSKVESIQVRDEQVRSVVVNGREIEVSTVISTAPINLLPRLVQGTDSLTDLAEFRFKPMVLVNVMLEGRHLLPNTVLWLPEKKFPFFRLTEAPWSMPWLAPEGKTIITCDIGADVGDEIWTRTDEELGEFCLDHLEEIIPGVRQRYLGVRALRTPIAYPIFLRKYEERRLSVTQDTGIAGLHSVGRNGGFDHLPMEDAYHRTLRRVDRLTAALSA